MRDVNGTMNLDDGGVPQCTNGHQGSSSEAQPYQLIPTAWLKQKKAWPDHLKAAQRDYMLTHQFFNYKSTQHESCLHLNSLVQQLQHFFDQTDWDISVHPAKLEEKVRRQMHTIRVEIERDARDPVLELRAFLQKVPNEKHVECMHVILEEWGRETVSAGLAFFDMLDFDETRKSGFILE